MIDRTQLREALRQEIRISNAIDLDKQERALQLIADAAFLVADPDTLVISKVDGEWPNDVQNTIANLILQGLEPHFVPLSIRYGLAVGVLGVLLEGQPK